MVRSNCPSGQVAVNKKCLPIKRLDKLYDEFVVEMSVDPFNYSRSPRQNMELFMREKHPNMRPRRDWIDGLYYIYKEQVK